LLKTMAIVLAALALSGCAQQFSGSAYRLSVGRQVTEFFQDTHTTWGAVAEYRFDVKR
jgi:outer membrane lipoprotein SlyB